ncbi:UbiE/COQ5 methyltransferase [Jaminaea rosea]|uniref:2-methoxy-6-polyprenyl-1,4-benzoquinol methylase, mitochondrial n=1 Tax=Jaminaea rosea TaxID=1569628 RepID=A0A316UHS9_9BASI|nr:UbiE/COQ5 methyltransferase [Jaminaea rosea]PWN24822.1 UbiE/COQ5 methyltransferase [Jaminaea rosea]
MLRTGASSLGRSLRLSPSPLQAARCYSNGGATGESSPGPSSSSSRSGGNSSSSSNNDPETHFGFQSVPEALKESMVGGVFSSVSSSYDVMNDAMSLGIHRLWKNHFVSTVLDPRGGINCLDVAGGTGDIALRILDHARTAHADRETRVSMLDINADMLREGMVRCKRESMYWGTDQLGFQLGNAERLGERMVVPPPTSKKAIYRQLPELKSEPVPDSSVDLYTIAFGIRNCTHIDQVLKEAYRVLKPGGVFGCLEFGKVGNPYFAELYRQYSFRILPSLGHLLASDSASYQYLVESIERFPSQPDFAQMIREAGFCTPGVGQGSQIIEEAGLGQEYWAKAGGKDWEDLSGGIASIWVGVKL